MRIAIIYLLTLAMLISAAESAKAITLTGAPNGVSNDANPEIYVSGQDVVAYKYALNSGSYSPELPLNVPIRLRADVTIDGQTMLAGSKELYEFLNARTDIYKNSNFTRSLTLTDTQSDVRVVYLINKKRFFLNYENILNLSGQRVNQLMVQLNSKTAETLTSPELSSFCVKGGTLQLIADSPIKRFHIVIPQATSSVRFTPRAENQQVTITVNGVTVSDGQEVIVDNLSDGQVVNVQSADEGGGQSNYELEIHRDGTLDPAIDYGGYYLNTPNPADATIRLFNAGTEMSSLHLNLNGKEFANDLEIFEEIVQMAPVYPGEPLQAKAWRFILDNSYHYYPVTSSPGGDWIHSPAVYVNSIGFGLCSDVASIYYQLMQGLGYQSRVWGLNGHVVPEVFVNNRWEMWDPDLKVYYFNLQGNVASVADLSNDPGLITNPINPILAAGSFPYSQSVADIYASTGDNSVSLGNTTNPISDYAFTLDVPPGSVFEFPGTFDTPLITTYGEQAPVYANALLTVPRGWSGELSTPLVIHSIGYSTTPSISVLAKHADGSWDAEPTVASWTLDFIPPQTTATQPSGFFNPDEPVTLAANKPATIYYTLDRSTPSTDSPQYSSPVSIQTSTVINYFSVDTHGNREGVKTYAAPVSSVSLSMSQPSESSLRFEAQASGTSDQYEYLFIFSNPLKFWKIGQPYGTSPTWNWNTTGLTNGEYMVRVLARNVGSRAAFEAYSSYNLYVGTPVAGANMAASVASPQTVGGKIVFTATAEGGSGSYEYQYVMKNPLGTWSTVQPYGSQANWTWNTAGAAPGSYDLQVWVRNMGSQSAYEAVTRTGYTLYPPVAGATVVASSASPQTVGGKIVFMTTAAGGSGSYEYQYVMKNPLGTWSTVQPYGSLANWAWDTTGAASGSYDLQVWVRNRGAQTAYEAVARTRYTLYPPVAGATVAASTASPQTVGGKIVFTTTATGGSGSYEYQYVMMNPQGTWSTVQPYGTLANWTWDTTGAPPGSYDLQVWVRNRGSQSTYEAVARTDYTLFPPVAGATVTASVASPQTVGGKIVFTTTAAGGSGSYEYQYVMKNPQGTWTTMQPYSTQSNWTWDTTGAPPGSYDLQAWVRNKGAILPYETVGRVGYILSSPVSGATMAASIASPQTVGGKIVFTTTATGGSGSYEYQFVMLPPQGTWTTVQPFGSQANWTWDTAGAAPGSYDLQVWVRNKGAQSEYEAVARAGYTLSPPVVSATIAASATSPQTVGGKIVFSATAAGGSGSYEYQYMMKNPLGTWTTVQPYGSLANWTWDTTGAAPGSYNLQVWVRNAGTTGKYDVWKSTAFSIVLPAQSANLVGPAAATGGASVTFSATAIGGSGSYEYQFIIRTPQGNWSIMQPYSTKAAWTWDTSGLDGGNYTVQVWVRNAGSTAAYDTWNGTTLTLTLPLTVSPLLADKTSPQAPGAVVTFSAGAGGGLGSYEYQFALRDPQGGWRIVQAYGASASWRWDTFGISPGNYQIQVWVRNAGTTATYDAWQGTEYVIGAAP